MHRAYNTVYYGNLYVHPTGLFFIFFIDRARSVCTPSGDQNTFLSLLRSFRRFTLHCRSFERVSRHFTSREKLHNCLLFGSATVPVPSVDKGGGRN